MNIQIDNENPTDAARIHEITAAAFLNAPHTDHTEQYIVDALRQAGALSVSQVAKVDGEIVAHVAVSPVTVSDDATGWFGLGPISVLPEFQRKGIGSVLMKSALAALKSMGAAGCVVLGEPGYYSRFGFHAIEGLMLPGVPAQYFQALSFNGAYPQGEVSYHAAFSVRG